MIVMMMIVSSMGIIIAIYVARNERALFANFAFFFHSPILKPDFHLPLVQPNRGRDLDSSLSREILAKAVFLLELERLLSRIDLTVFAFVKWTIALVKEIRLF
jgi:hypothetical protein